MLSKTEYLQRDAQSRISSKGDKKEERKKAMRPMRTYDFKSSNEKHQATKTCKRAQVLKDDEAEGEVDGATALLSAS